MVGRASRRAAWVGWAMLASGCLVADPPDGVFVCGRGASPCPPGFYCVVDRCWHEGRSPDLATLPGADLAGADLAGADLAGASTDLARNFVCPPRALCDDFEGGAFAPFWMSPHEFGGTVTLDTSRSHRGTHSVRFHDNALLTSQSADVRLATEAFLTRSPRPTDFFVRAFYFIPTTPPTSAQMITSVQVASPYPGVGTESRGSVFATTNSITHIEYASATPVPLNQWFCMEWQVHLAQDAGGYMKMWLNDVELTDVYRNQPTDPPPRPPTALDGLRAILVGYDFYNAATAVPATDVWVDDVAINTMQVGCQ